MAGSSSGKNVVIVGAGIVGAACAYFLTRKGFSVRLLDAVAPAAAASGAADGAVSVASKRPGPMMTAALAGIALYQTLERDGTFAGLFKRRPTIMVAEDRAEAETLERHADALSAQGRPLRRIEARDLFLQIPVVSRHVQLAIEVGDEGHAIGYEIVRRLIAASGVTVERNTPVIGLLESSGTGAVTAIQTPRGGIEADHFVIAAGGGSSALIGLNGATRPRKGQLIITERAPGLAASLPGSLMSCRYLLSKDAIQTRDNAAGRRFGLVIDPLRTGQFLIGGTREDSADTGNDIAAVRQMLGNAVRLLPALGKLRVIRTFAGVRTATSDGLPMIGRAPGRENLFVAAGFEGDGICLGPLVGKAISQLLGGQTPAIDLRPFDPARFEARSMVA